ncbi:MAG: MATE family efflux transporter [Mediterranea sp.]|nr:MATE family efflux transporter [Mediterranea sp.]
MSYRTHYTALARLGLPIVVGQIGMMLVGFADTLMIGHHSTQELAAASFVNNLMILAVVTGIGFSMGLTPVVGALCGQKRLEDAGIALRCSIKANSGVGILLTLLALLLYLFIDQLGQPDELLPLIRPYYLIVSATLLPVMWFNSGKQFTDGIALTRYGMWILLAGNGLNILGNWLLINGIGPFPELGLQGAGISTLFSRLAMVAAYVIILSRGERFAPFRIGLFSRKHHQEKRQLFRRLCLLGFPMAMQSGMETASFSLTAIMVGWLGTVALASHQIMCTISQFNFMMYLGLGTAVSIRISHFYGQGDMTHVKQTASAGFHLMLILEVMLSLLLILMHKEMGGWFTDSPEVTAMVASLFVVFIAYQFGDGLQINYANALRGIADVKVLVIIAFIAYFIISLPASYLFAFPLGLGLPGVWMGFPFGLTSAGLMLWWRFRRKSNNNSAVKNEHI